MDNLARLMAAVDGLALAELRLLLRFAEFLAKEQAKSLWCHNIVAPQISRDKNKRGVSYG